MTNIVRGTITIPFSAEVDAEITDGASLLDYYDKHAWQFVDFAQHEDTDTVVTWEKGCGVEVTEFVSGATLGDEYATRAL